MSGFSTIQELMGSDMTEGRARMRRYWSSSSLPAREKHVNAPKLCDWRRDKVLRKLMKNEMNALSRRLMEWQKEQ